MALGIRFMVKGQCFKFLIIFNSMFNTKHQCKQKQSFLLHYLHCLTLPSSLFLSVCVSVCYVYVHILCVCLSMYICLLWQALMQAHDSVAVQDMTDGENMAQYLGETVKLVRLEKTLDTPLVRYHDIISMCSYLVYRRMSVFNAV